MVQSLYRHLARRPAFLALAVTLLRQRFDDGSIDRGTAAILERMEEAADTIVGALEAPPVRTARSTPAASRARRA